MADFARQYMISGPEDSSNITTLVASQIETGTLKFLDFIASVQEYAVDDDLTIQAKSIEYIASVLALLKPETLPRIEISVLVAFLRTRIEDNAGVKEASQGLRSLMGMNRFIKKDSVEIMDTLFKNTADLQRQPASARFAIYQLVEKSLERCREVLEGMGERFIDGVLSLVEFEKDPRNLMVVFSFLRVIMAEFAATDSQTAALWDAVFRYYPISYRPKPEDKIQITKQDLQSRLESCLTSNSRFAPFAFPSLLAKLDQEIGATVKVETLATMSACIMAFSPAAVIPHVLRSWSLVKFDAYNQMDVHVALQGAKVLQNLTTKTFEQGEDGMHQRELVKLVTKDILDSMETPTEESERKASLIITAIASGSPVAFSLVLRSIMPALLTIYEDLDGKIAEMTVLLKLFNRVLDDANYQKGSTFYNPPAEHETQIKKLDCIKTLDRFREKLLELFDTALRQQETSIRITSLQGLVKLAQVPCFLSYEEIGMIVQSIGAFAMADKEELREEAIEGLKKLSSITKDQIRSNSTSELRQSTMDSSTDTCHDGVELIVQIVFPAMVAATALPTGIDYSQLTKLELNVLKHKLIDAYESWAAISSDAKVFDAFLRFMKMQLEQALDSHDLDFTRIVLMAIGRGLDQHITHFKKFSGGLKFPLNNSPIDYVQFVKELFKLVVQFDEQSLKIVVRNFPNVSLDDATLGHVGTIARLVFRSVEAAQQEAAYELFSLFVTEGVQVDKNSLGSSTILEQGRSLLLTKELFASLRPGPKLLMAYDLNQLAGDIIQSFELQGEADSYPVILSVSGLLGLFFNKYDLKTLSTGSKAVTLDTAMRSLLAACYNEEEPMNVQQALPIMSLVFQYTVGMVKKGADEIYCSVESDATKTKDAKENIAKLPFLSYLASFLNIRGGELLGEGRESAGGGLIAELFGNILDDSKTPLTKKNHAIISARYKKKFYEHVFPVLVELMEAHPDRPSTQKNCLVALTGVINHVSGENFVLETNPVTIMLRALNLDIRVESKRAALELMISAARNNPSTLSSHYNSVINRLTGCMGDQDHVVRALAIHCTACLASLEPQVNSPYKARVLRQLSRVVGDSDAKVRTEAVDCRMKWFNIDELSDD